MKIRTMWQWMPDQPHLCPWIIAAVDEYSVDENGGLPADYPSLTADRRELILEIPENVVRKLFATPVQVVMAAEPPPAEQRDINTLKRKLGMRDPEPTK